MKTQSTTSAPKVGSRLHENKCRIVKGSSGDKAVIGGTVGVVMQTPNNIQDTLRLFTPAQLSQRWQVTGMTLHRWRKAGRLKALHLGRGIRFSLTEVERFEREAEA